MLDMPFKFFPRDVIAGNANKPGDVFTAEVFGGKAEFTVMPDHFTRECFFATMNGVD